MKILNLLKFLLFLLLLVAILPACDRIDEDVSPSTAGKLFLNNDFYTTTQNKSIQLNPLQNDTIGGQATLQIGNPAHGTLAADSSQPGLLVYMPQQNFAGTDTFSYSACLGPNCARALVTIQVLPDSAQQPGCNLVARNDFLTLPENSSDTINVLANDSACGLIPVITAAPANGSAQFSGNSGLLQYTPRQGFSGTDILTYRLSDGNRSASATVEFTVTAAPCMPLANPDAATVNQGASVTVNVLANDNACSIAPVITIAPQHGTAVFTSPGMLRYTPDSTYSGPDEVEYELANATGASKAKVSFTVVSNCVVRARPDSAFMAAINDTVSVEVLQNDFLCNGTNPVVTITTQPANGSASVVQFGNRAFIIYQKQQNAQPPYYDVVHYRVCVTVSGQQRCSASSVGINVY